MKHSITKTILFLLVINQSEAASTQVNWRNTTGTEVRDLNGTLLTSGTDNANDGAILQLGYYTMATTLNPFAGLWVPLTGEGSGNSFYSTVGDKALPDGRFDIGLSFFTATANLPIAGTPLAIRFYDSTSIATATYFNAVSNTTGTWNWITPVDPRPTIIISLSDPGVVLQDGPTSAFRTTIAVPEPSCLLLGILSLGALVVRRRSN